MATIKHRGILLLQSAQPRLVDPGGSEALVITPTASTISISENASAQLASQNTVVLTATCSRADAVINWSTTQGSLSAQTGTSVTLTYSTVPVVDMSNIIVTATTSADSKYSPATLTKTATVTKVIPPKTSIEIVLYKRATTAPDTLPSAATYNTSTKVVGGALNGWSVTIPAGTDPIYITKATIDFYSTTPNVARPITGWQTQALLAQNGTNGTNGSDATVNMTNLKTTIEANSSTQININSSSTLFRTSSGNGGVFIGGGGLYGKDSGGNTTFAIDGSSGQAQFTGTITASTVQTQATGERLVLGTNTLTAYNSSNLATFSINKNGQVQFQGGQYTTDSVNYGALGVTVGATTNQTAISGLIARNIRSSGGQAIFAEVTSQFGDAIYARSTDSTQQAITGYNQATGGVAINSQGTLQVGQNVEARLRFSIPASSRQWEILVDSSNTSMYWKYNNSTSNQLVLDGSGNLTALGNVTAYSDTAIKQHIRPISQATNKLKQIDGYQYKNLLANKYDCGIIAQEIEKILPELVQVGSTEYEGTQLKTVNYNGVVALLVAANRELIARVEALEKQLHASTNIGSNKLS